MTLTDHQGTPVVTASGDFDIASAPLLREAFLEALLASNRTVLDLSGTTFVDSTVLSIIVEARKRAATGGGWLRIAAPRPNIRRVFRLLALDTIIGIYASVAEAVEDAVRDIDLAVH